MLLVYERVGGVAVACWLTIFILVDMLDGQPGQFSSALSANAYKIRCVRRGINRVLMEVYLCFHATPEKKLSHTESAGPRHLSDL